MTERNRKYILHEVAKQGLVTEYGVNRNTQVSIVIEDVLFLGMVVQCVGDHHII